jgi:hypothetical protein
MVPFAAVSLSQSGGSITGLVIGIGLLVLDFVAVAKIITKAGYSSRWILVPLAPVFLWLVSIVLLAVDVRTVVVGGAIMSVPVSLANFKVLEILDFLSVIVTWVFFLIFAFSDWPVSTQRREPMRPFAKQPADFAYAGQAQPRPVSAPGYPGIEVGGPATTNVVAGASPVTPGTFENAAPQPAGQPEVIFCSWCGKERAVDAQAIHHCGSMDRPAVHCMSCGTRFEVGATNCASCGTPVTKLSR